MIAGLVHTVPALAGTFDALLHDRLPDAEAVHVADAWLLSEAMRAGVGPTHHERLTAHVDHLARRGADAVLVTCSSIGEVADAVAAASPVPVLRVDRPMAREAGQRAAAGHGLVVALATISATLEPTGRLLRAEAPGGVRVDARHVPGALAARDAGDEDTFAALITDAVDEALGEADVVMLAQASMAAALPDDRGGRVLTSPSSAVDALVARLSP